MTLSTDEYNALDKIATATKMDCWFLIEQDSYGNDFIHDLENNVNLTLEEGLAQLADGIVNPLDYDYYGLTNAEIEAVLTLFAHFGLEVTV